VIERKLEIFFFEEKEEKNVVRYRKTNT